MEQGKKLNNVNVVEPSPRVARLFFFWVGILATVAYRIIIVLNLYDPLWVKIAWYIGTVGFVLYFGHRYRVAKKRADLVKKYNLVEVVNRLSEMDSQKKTALSYLVETSLTSKSRWNAAAIFLLSLVALVAGILIDIIG